MGTMWLPQASMSVLTELAPYQGLGLGGIVVVIILLMLTDRLVWHKRLEKEEHRTAKAQEQTEKALDLISGVGEQVEKLVQASEQNARNDDMSVALLRGIRRHLGIAEGDRR